tara:strand:- start:415 stop:1836 length:1422 start_codon:yes stop_codon:yes gene_type:complete
MQQSKLNVITNFIHNNSKYKKKFFDRFEIDSRKIHDQQIFISLEENAYRNSRNILDAIKKKASAVVSTLPYDRNYYQTTIPFLFVEDLKDIYYQLFSNNLDKNKKCPKIIGITGTNGKTSTLLLLAEALMIRKNKIGVISSEGIGIFPKLRENSYTTPTLDIIYKNYNEFLISECDYIIIECSSQGLHQGRLKGILFDYALITNIYSDHLDYHRTLSSYIDSKLQLINQSKVAVLNYDSPVLRRINNIKHKLTKIYYVSQTKQSMKNLIKVKKCYSENNLERFHISSLLLIVAIMKREKIKDNLIKKSISKLSSPKGRRNIIYTKNKGTFIIDYAHTTQAYKEIYKDFKTDNSVTTLFGCGGDRDKTKRKSIGKIVEKYSNKIFITEDNSRSEDFTKISVDILIGINKKSKCLIEKSRKKALNKLFNQSRRDDINFILGKGSENYIHRGKQKIKHNDLEYIENMIEKNEIKNI